MNVPSAAWSAGSAGYTPVGVTQRDEPASAASGERAIHELAHDPLAPGQVISGKYRVHGELGRGGFAVVYEAEHLGLRRAVALKVLHRSAGTPTVLLDRFAREVRISALVRHPHVLQVHDVGVLADGSPFLVMEKIHGETLQHHLYLAGRLNIEQTIALSQQLLSALVALAAHGIVHRDIKPDNLMLTCTDSGELLLKLVDFGIALVRDERLEPRLTRHGALVGTPHYMAPEQLRSEVIDARVDIYATGVLMYQALTGRMPFDGEDLCSLTFNVLQGEACSLRSLRPDCPAQLARIVERALAREPERRFPSAASMLAALDDVASEHSSLELLARALLRVAARVALGSAVLAGCLLWIPERKSASHVDLATPNQAASAQSEPHLTQLSAEPAGPDVLPWVDAVPTTEQLPRSPGRTSSSATSPRAVDQGRAADLCRKALALYLHGETAAARSAYRQATQADPYEPSAFRGLGLSASRLGKTHEARRAYTRYLELTPEAADAELVRARLAELSAPADR
jgi:serine/threonine-protein kinase